MISNSVSCAVRAFFILLPALLLAACAGSAEVTGGGGASISQVEAAPYYGPKARIVVGPIIDATGDGNSSTSRLGIILGSDGGVTPSAFLSGVRDMLVTALFQSNRYIILEREHLKDLLVEQEFSHSRRAGDATALPLKRLEGADLLVVGALTSFDSGQSGGIAVPIPFPLDRNHRDWGVIDLEMRTAAAALDLRVIDVATGRIVATVAVEGKARKFGASWAGIFSTHHGYIRLPGLLSVFENTPVEKALNDMVEAAAKRLAEKTPAIYYRVPAATPQPAAKKPGTASGTPATTPTAPAPPPKTPSHSGNVSPVG